MKKRTRLFVISAPAGTGKTTLVGRLIAHNKGYVRSITCTTRPKRPGEKEKKDYHFLTEQAFQKRKARGEFLESATVFGYNYGTSKRDVLRLLRAGQHVFLVIDTQGAMELKRQRVPAVLIFISPPSLAVLKSRLEKRKTEDAVKIKERLAWAKQELRMIGAYDYHVVNDDLETAYAVLKSIVVAEEHRVRKDEIK